MGLETLVLLFNYIIMSRIMDSKSKIIGNITVIWTQWEDDNKWHFTGSKEPGDNFDVELLGFDEIISNSFEEWFQIIKEKYK